VAALTAQTIIAVGDQGSIVRTSDAGVTWKRLSSGTAATLLGVSFIDANTGIAIGRQGAILRTLDGGATWTPQPSSTTLTLSGVSFRDDGSATVVGGTGPSCEPGIGAARGRLRKADYSRPQRRLLHQRQYRNHSGSERHDSADCERRTTWAAQSSGTRNWLCGVSFTNEKTGFAVAMEASSCGQQMAAPPGPLGPVVIVGPSMRFPCGCARRNSGGRRRHDSTYHRRRRHLDTRVERDDRLASRRRLHRCRRSNRRWKPGYDPANRGSGRHVAGPVRDGYQLQSLRGLLHRCCYRNRSRREWHDSAHQGRGVTWTPQSSGTNSWLYGVSFTDTDTGTAVGEAGTILRTTDGGRTWSRQSSGTNARLTGVSFTGAKTGIAAGANGTILRTTDGGGAWSIQPSGTVNWLWGVSFADADTGTAVGNGGTILRTTDGGVTWNPQFAGAISYSLRAVAMIGADTATTVGDFNSMILRTSDGGVTWGLQSSGTTNFLSGVWFTDPNTGVVVGGEGSCSPSISTVLRTTDGGASWKRQVTGSSRALFGVFFIDANTGWAVGEGGVILHTTTGGEPPAALLPQPAGLTEE